MLNMVEGKRSRGRPRTRWLDEVKEMVRCGMQGLRETVADRYKWRERVDEIARSRPRLGGR